MKTTCLELKEHKPSGIKTIEASAGTGKTYTLMVLVYKALLTLSDKGKNKHISIKNVLAVTFTEAATKELKSRIRETLVTANDFYGKNVKPNDEEILKIFEQDSFTASEKAIWASYLNEQLQKMDESSIFTIHGFCNKIINEYPFECGIPGKFQLSKNLEDELADLVRQEWRKLIRRGTKFDYFLEHLFESPEKMVETFGKELGSSIILEHDEEISDDFELLVNEFEKRRMFLIEQFGIKFIEKEMADFFNQASKFKSNMISFENVPIAIQNLTKWLSSTIRFQSCKTIDDAFELAKYFNIAYQSRAKKSKETIDYSTHQKLLFDDLNFLLEYYFKINSEFAKPLTAYFIAQIQTKFQELKRENAWFGFDDMLLVTEKALKNNTQLITQLKQDYPIGFIDEFQDTDPVQFSVFRQIFLENDSSQHKTKAFYMIGDPKQSIYSFRNADLNTYLFARNKSEEVLTLDTNYRSSESLINSVNEFFSNAKNPFSKEEIPFKPVKSKKEGGILAPFKEIESPTVIFNAEGYKSGNKDSSRRFAMRMSIDYVKYLLNNEVYIDNGKDLKTRVQPADIALLVKTNKTADLLYNSLRIAGVPAVIQSRKSVFTTRDAYHLLVLVRSIQRSRTLSSVRLALMTQFFEISSSELDELTDDSEEILMIQEVFMQTQSRWKNYGLGAAMSFLSSTYNLTLGMLKNADGDRSVANFKQLIEMLSNFERDSTGGPTKTIQYLERKIQEAKEGKSASDDEMLQLESDEKKVKIVTIHSSKGLEYPIVIIPFMWERKHVTNYIKNHVQAVSIHEENQEPKVKKFLVDDIEQIGKTIPDYHKEETEIEEARLMYVAMTRAKYQNVIIIPEYEDKLGGNNPLSMIEVWAGKANKNTYETKLDNRNKTVYDYLRTVKKSLGNLKTASYINHNDSLKNLKLKESPLKELESLEATLSVEKTSREELNAAWKDTSYSAIAHSGSVYSESHDDENQKRDDENQEEPEGLKIQKKTKSIGVHALKAGNDFGNIIHYVFEHLYESNEAEIKTIVSDAVQFYGYQKTFQEKEQDEISTFISQIFRTPMVFPNKTETSLAEIPLSKQKRESEFLTGINSFSLNDFYKIIRNTSAEDVLFESGFIKGFIDFVFIHNNKFYMLDYKSNKLGIDKEDYTNDKIKEAMLKSKFDVQLYVYSLALHRWLKATFKEYSYETHFGGMFYWFIRGYENETKGLYFEKANFTLIEELEQLISKKDIVNGGVL